MNVKEFIEKVLINEFKEIQQRHGYHYISFILISAGIEFLGSCMDSEAFSQPGLSERRFREAIDDLFPNGYDQYNQKSHKYDLYTNLRCGMLHVVIPMVNIELIQKAEMEKYDAEHLEIKNIHGSDRLVLVSEELFEDFENACREVIRRIDAKELADPKVYRQLILT